MEFNGIKIDINLPQKTKTNLYHDDKVESRKVENINDANYKLKDSLEFKQKRIYDCYLRNCKFENADFTGTEFHWCNLEKADFTNCDLYYTVFFNCRLDYKNVLKSAPVEINLKYKLIRNLYYNELAYNDDVNIASLYILMKKTKLNLLKLKLFSGEQYYKKHREDLSFVEKNKLFSEYVFLKYYGLTSSFGNSIFRWFVTCIFLIGIFGLTFWHLNNNIDLPENVMVSAFTFFQIDLFDFTKNTNFSVEILIALVERFIGVVQIGMLVSIIFKKIRG